MVALQRENLAHVTGNRLMNLVELVFFFRDIEHIHDAKPFFSLKQYNLVEHN